MSNKSVTIPDPITVGQLAEALGIASSTLITELFKNGIPATINEKLDFETASIVVEEIQPDTTLEKEQQTDETQVRELTRKRNVSGSQRPPVVAVMGHVDHGKTSLLDKIRTSNIVNKEAGGITQHISAYQITHNDRQITFLDTPGHEAFASLREHGAKLTDIAIIVVAADDGIKPQTKEAVRFATAAGVKIIVAITKVDKDTADINRVKQQLAEENLQTEDWGGETIAVPVSSKTGEGVDQLLDMIILLADVEELKAETDVPGEGLVIESHIEQGRGPVVNVLVEQGTMRKGDFVVAGSAYGKIRTLDTTDGTPIKVAGPSTPVTITGFKSLPDFGKICHVIANEKEARNQASLNGTQSATQAEGMSSNDLIRLINKKNAQTEVNVVIKADVQGSLTSVIDSLRSLETEDIALNIVRSGVGNISERDVHLAQTSNSIIYGFNVQLPTDIKRIALRDGVKIEIFKVIYELIDSFREEASSRLSPEVIETVVGSLRIAGVFRTSKNAVICGGEVIEGKAVTGAHIRIRRGEEAIGEALVSSVKRGPTETKEVPKGEMCGIQLTTTEKINLEIDDILEFVTTEEKTRSI